jgi:hypothetical protein
VPLTIAPARSPEEGRRPLAFVEVTGEEASAPDAPDTGVAPLGVPGKAAAGEPEWSLWGDLEG